MYANLTKLKEGDANEIKRNIMHIEYQESSVFSKEFLAFVPFLKYGSSLRKILKLVLKNKKMKGLDYKVMVNQEEIV
ncbi:hypothetical protein QUF81_07370 [Peribacillus simplex]|uniref:hypothetical protein n=2 Tax=Peribacillus TaxID=2675229 RepID=UPI0025A1F219|nr:hypothetical protein [Peribacillus simplex]MDM5293017.1 hypothetical protein [Peribacillus simplex]